MKDNTVKTENGIEVYKSSVEYYADEYINTLPESKNIYKKQCFAGMIKYISKHIDKPNTDNLVLLNYYWDIYTESCYKYNQIITIERYCILINIHRDTFYSWINGETRNDYCEELGSSRSDMLKKWSGESESSLQDEASTGNPGAMFILKARNGWQETAPVQNPISHNGITKTPEQIAAEMGVQYIEEQHKKAVPNMDF